MQKLEEAIWHILESVPDPEIPVLSVTDLGIVREVVTGDFEATGEIKIVITPTYSGCPAMDMISMQIRLGLLEHGYQNVKIVSVLSPVWTTDWMTESGKQKLKEYGIAPPVGKSIDQQLLENTAIQCPQCGSWNVKLVSEFASTACKAFYTCNDCLEPFDYFKCH